MRSLSTAVPSLPEAVSVPNPPVAAKSAKLSYGILNISGPALQVLTLTRLDKIFSIYDSTEQFQSQLTANT